LIVVTGASGNIGSALLRELREAGHPVRAGYHSQPRAAQAAESGQESVTIDLSQPDTLPPALDGAETVFLLAPSGPSQPGQEQNLIAAAKAAGVRRVVKLSVWRADERLTPIARLHRPGEEALQSSGLAWTFLRPNFYMQNFLRHMASSIRDSRSFSQPESSAAIAFVDTRDIARVAARVLVTSDHDGRIYDITGPEALTYQQAAEVLSGVLGSTVRFRGLPDEQARAEMVRSGLPAGYADTLIEVNRAYRDGGVERVTPTVRDLTGHDPGSLEQFVRDHLPVFQ
jgi:uncharacterized protein YbjT (DUF2867 family)